MKQFVLLICALFSLGAFASDFGFGFDNDFSIERRRAGRGQPQVVECSSWGDKYQRCYVDREIRRVEVARQHSSDSCVEGRSWGYDRDSIWVDNGCRADFYVYGRRSLSESVECSSWGGKYNTCYLDDYVRSVTLVQQISSDSCEEGRSWGYTDDRIWVDDGCRGLFRVRYY